MYSFSDGMKDIQNLRFLCYSSCSKEKEKKFSYLYLKFSLVHRYSAHEDDEVYTVVGPFISIKY